MNWSKLPLRIGPGDAQGQEAGCSLFLSSPLTSAYFTNPAYRSGGHPALSCPAVAALTSAELLRDYSSRNTCRIWPGDVSYPTRKREREIASK